MKITFLIQDLFQQGAQYVTALMIRGFIAKGYDIDLIVSKVHADLLKNSEIEPFEVPESTNIIILGNRQARKNIGELRRYLQTTDSLAVISMSSNYTVALALASIALRKRPKIAYVEHSSYVGLDRITGTDKPAPSRYSISSLKSWLIAKRFDSIMAVSSGTARGVERTNRLAPNSVSTVYNPAIDEAYFTKLAQAPQHPWLKNKSIPTFVAAGAHCKFKNHLNLFSAIKLANERTPVRVILFGKGELTDQYKQWISDNNMEQRISIAAHTTQLPAEIKASDGFLISSDMESFSIVLVEALAAGAPIISTACPYGPPELLKNGEFGTLVPINNPEIMASAIVNQIRSPRPGAPNHAWAPFTLPKVVLAYEKALHLNRITN